MFYTASLNLENLSIVLKCFVWPYYAWIISWNRFTKFLQNIVEHLFEQHFWVLSLFFVWLALCYQQRPQHSFLMNAHRKKFWRVQSEKLAGHSLEVYLPILNLRTDHSKESGPYVLCDVGPVLLKEHVSWEHFSFWSDTTAQYWRIIVSPYCFVKSAIWTLHPLVCIAHHTVFIGTYLMLLDLSWVLLSPSTNVLRAGNSRNVKTTLIWETDSTWKVGIRRDLFQIQLNKSKSLSVAFWF